MSQTESDQAPAAAEPQPILTELERARQEDPAFVEDLARVRAAARGEIYEPAKHLPRMGRRRIDDDLEPAKLERMEEIVAGWEKRGARAQRHLWAVRGG
jgi:hypothetical protein